MKIENLYEINELNTKATLLLNHNIDNEFYDFYFNNELNWLLENQEKIRNNFNENIEKLKFDIIINTDLDERIELIVSLKKATINEFANYINFIPFESLNLEEKKEIEKQFANFKNLNNEYEAIQYFEHISRK